MTRFRLLRALALALALSLVVAACGDDDDTSSDDSSTTVADSGDSGDEGDMDEGDMDDMDEGAAADSSTICDAEGLVEAVQSGAEEGTLEGMADDPVGTAASSNPVLTTLVSLVQSANLVDTLNSAEALTVFAPTDCAFAALPEALVAAATGDVENVLTPVLGFHVIPERLEAADLAEVTELTTFTGEVLPISIDADGVGTVNTGTDFESNVVVPSIQTANATVYLIDSVMVPPSLAETALSIING